MPSAGSVFSLHISTGGVPKSNVSQAWLGALGFQGDGHHDKKHHGGPERAVSLWSVEIVQALAAEGHPIYPGATGENIAATGLAWAALAPGVTLQLGPEVVVQISTFCTPCRTIAHCFHDGDFKRVSHLLRPELSRLYARVLREGWVTRGDEIVVGG